MNLRYLSVCSGLEGASLAWEPLGWRPVGFAEIEAFPSAIIAHRHPNGPPNFGDFTMIETAKLGPVDVLVGGTPCQGFSIAGKRLSLADSRSNLALAYVVLAHELAGHNGLRNAVWENVPGVLSMRDNAFGCFLGALVGCDAAIPAPFRARWPDAGMVGGPRARAAWRVLDAQYFGVPQRRARVFVVADFGNGADPAEILFEPKGVRGDFATRGEAGQGLAAPLAAGSRGGGGYRNDADAADNLIAHALRAQHNSAHAADKDNYLPVAYGGNNCAGAIDVATALTAHGGPSGRLDFESETFIAHALRAEGFDASEDGTGRGTPLVPVAFRTSGNSGAYETGDRAGALTTGTDNSAHVPVDRLTAIAFDLRGRDGGAQVEGPHDTANIRAASGGSSRSYVAQAWGVRRLTPVECERLQGVPDGHTRIPWRARPAEECPDGPRYRALGNSWAVPVVRWLGERIDASIARQSQTERKAA